MKAPTENQTIKALTKFGDIQVFNENLVFTVLITGTDLTNMLRQLDIQDILVRYAADRYPIIEVMKNEDNYFLAVLKPDPEDSPF
jgi:hypothetical protein